ncbi:hypothetical protein ES705_49120 [subsurface metagenome]
MDRWFVMGEEIFEKYKENPLFLERLQIAQRLWIQFRDAHMDSVFPFFEDVPNMYGSSYPMCYYIELTNLTWKRVMELESFILEPDEGEMCNGIRGVYNIYEY